jgi:myo-inositol 2-dehydrogenase/D-chiro-inositol 1-dehydrogenase
MKGQQKKTHTGRNSKQISRRQFVAGASAAALTFSIIKPQLVRGSQANSKISLGIIGCGGRGVWLADLCRQHGGYEIAAGADYFGDRVNNLGQSFKIPKDRLYDSLSGYRKLLDSDVDAVMIETPPYFHPEQVAAAVEAGKHVYLAKPIAVDVPGCQSIGQSGEKATENKLCFLVDFQTRANEFYIEALKRIHTGAIGDLVFGEATYHAGFPFNHMVEALAKDSQNPENRLRAWGLDRVLSGDIITEQNIHTLDVLNWVMDKPPLQAFGNGGRKFRNDAGNIWGNFTVLFQYTKDVGVTFSSRQSNGYGTDEGIKNRMFGTRGVLETTYGGQVLIRAPQEHFYRGGNTSDIYTEGAKNNIAAFHDNITKGKFENTTVKPSVQSNLLTILGRTAAYENRVVTWKEIINSREKLQIDLKGLKS